MHAYDSSCWFGPRGHRHGRFLRRFGRGFMGDDDGTLRAARMLSSADLQLVLLALIGETPRHGYELIKALEEHTAGFYSPSPGVVYPALTYLEEIGYTSAEAAGTKKLHRLTPEGAAHLEKNRTTVDAILRQLAEVGRRASLMRDWFAQRHGSVDDGAELDPRALARELHQLRREFRALLGEAAHASSEKQRQMLAIVRRAIDDIRELLKKQ
jgi:DNA-binding PadR family transcriptional regulator